MAHDFAWKQHRRAPVNMSSASILQQLRLNASSMLPAGSTCDSLGVHSSCRLHRAIHQLGRSVFKSLAPCWVAACGSPCRRVQFRSRWERLAFRIHGAISPTHRYSPSGSLPLQHRQAPCQQAESGASELRSTQARYVHRGSHTTKTTWTSLQRLTALRRFGRFATACTSAHAPTPGN